MPCRRWLGLGRLMALASVASVAALVLAPLAYADPAAASVHVVQPDETLSQIAVTAGVDPAALAALNGLDDVNLLSVGQSLKLPARSASAGAGPSAPAPSTAGANGGPAPSAADAGGGTATPPRSRGYTVADGDTLWSIAQALGTTTAALVAANKLEDADHVVVGAQLVVPGAAGAAQAAAAAPVPGALAAAAATGATPSQPAGGGDAMSSVAASATGAGKRSLLVSYTVQAGETLGQIARQFAVRPEAIAQANGLDNANHIAVGSVLKVPLAGKEHVVAQGETLRDIAAQEKVDLGSLVDFNQIDDPELIHIGQVVLVPGVANQSAATNTAASASPSGASVASSTASSSAVPSSGAPAAVTGAGAVAGGGASTTTRSAAGTGSAAKATGVAPVAVVAAPPGAPSDGLVGAGLKFLGAPYVWGGSTPSGFDCSGFVWYVARQLSKPLSRGMLAEYNSGAHPGRDELKPGDLVFFQNTYTAGLSHTGIFIGNNQFVHAADEAAGVTISNLGAAYWSSHWFGATRLP